MKRTEAVSEWKMVPLEPTQEMVDAARSQSSFPAGVYRAMLSAAPQPEQKPVVWMKSNHLYALMNKKSVMESMPALCSDHQLMPDYKPLYTGPQPTADATPSPESLKRVADLKIELDIPDRYSCKSTQRISADQWRRICQILEEPAPTHIGREG